MCKNSSIVTDGAFLIDDRMDYGQPSRKLCPSMQTCCSLEYQIEKTTEEVTTTTSGSQGATDKVIPTTKPTSAPSTEKPPIVDCKSGEFKISNRCGARNVKGFGNQLEGKGDKYAQYGEFPWMMAIMNEVVDGNTREKSWQYRCGGSLIHSKLVVTAAHRFGRIFGAFCFLLTTLSLVFLISMFQR